MNPEKKLPSEFKNRIKSQLGDEADDFFSSLSQPPFLSVRINPFKPIDKFDKYETVPWCSEGKYLKSRLSFTFDPLFHAGTYYVQEPSSMFLCEIFNQIIDSARKLKVLDLCASPGGKSTLILSDLIPDSLLISNETIRNRVSALHENIMKWGVPNVFVTSNDSIMFSSIKNYFDVIVIDAPCSGEGLFRKDERAIAEWSENNVKLCSARQKRILSGVFDSLKEDGILIYSTCTFSEEENEENVKFIAKQENFDTVKIKLKEDWNISESTVSTGERNYFSYRFYPHRVKGEGFFVACFKKNEGVAGEHYHASLRPQNKYFQKISKEEIKIISPWLKNHERFEFIHWENQVFAVLREHRDDFIFLSQIINIRSSGICLGKIINGNLIPSHDFALSTIISEKIQSVELNEEKAIKFLRREEIVPIDTELRGWTLVKFSGQNLGWIKILEKRINNYLPKEYRIKSHKFQVQSLKFQETKTK